MKDTPATSSRHGPRAARHGKQPFSAESQVVAVVAGPAAAPWRFKADKRVAGLGQVERLEQHQGTFWRLSRCSPRGARLIDQLSLHPEARRNIVEISF